jgi:C1A family cysteine protease
MKPSVHIGLGNGFSGVFSFLTERILKYGDSYTLANIALLSINRTSDDGLVFEIFEEENLPSGIKAQMKFESEIPIVIKKENYNKHDIEYGIHEVFSALFDKFVNIQRNPQTNSLNICFHLPLWDNIVTELIIELIKLISKSDETFIIDIVGFAADMNHIIEKDSSEEILKSGIDIYKRCTKENILKISNQLDTEQNIVRNFIVLQNKQINGISLNLDRDLFIDLLSEFILLYTENYPKLFSVYNENKKIKGIGLSVLYFDKWYFSNYLISRTYLSILENENVNLLSADVNRLANNLNGILTKKFGERVNLFSHIWKEYISDQLNSGIDYARIVEEASPKINSFVKELGEELQSFLYDKTFSLPEKRAGLASILGEDDELFEGVAYNPDIPIVDDCEFEQADYFVKMNNHMVEHADYDLVNYAILTTEADPDGLVRIPLQEIKELKNKIRYTTQTIRNLEKRVAKTNITLEKEEIANKVLIDGDTFRIGDKTFKIIEKPIEEQLLEDDYSPKVQLPREVDLREFFPQVKNQGSLGACSAFSTVGVFEFISRSKGITLSYSESFVYFMARTYDGSTDKDDGSSIFNAIRALSDFGVCELQYWDPNGNYLQPPDAEARENATNNKVLKALNVKHNLNDIKSAISEGFPVCFGLKVYDSFGKPLKGFVTTPSEDAIQNENGGYHSMIICGYSDNLKVFIVRNSWGVDFGDNGYCYIPYSYIENKQLFNKAFIIKEITSGYFFHSKIKTVINFDLTDRLLEYAIIRNQLNEEKSELIKFKASYDQHRYKYLNITTKLTSIIVRNKLVEGEKKLLKFKHEEAEKEKDNLTEQKNISLKHVQAITAKVFRQSIITIVVIVALIIFSFLALDFFKVLKSEYLWLGSIFIGILSLFLPVWKKYRNTVYHRKKQEWNSKIEHINDKILSIDSEINILQLTSNIAGQVHQKMFDLKQTLVDKHKIMRSYVANLQEWYKAEQREILNMTPEIKLPFINVLKNNELDTFFETKANEVTEGLNLSDFILNYELSEKGIINFKKELRNKILSRLLVYVEGFNMYNHLSGLVKYPYVSYHEDQILEQLTRMQAMSKAFIFRVPHAMNQESNFMLAVNYPENTHVNTWKNTINSMFTSPPTEIKIKATDKILMVQIIENSTEDLSIMN